MHPWRRDCVSSSQSLVSRNFRVSDKSCLEDATKIQFYGTLSACIAGQAVSQVCIQTSLAAGAIWSHLACISMTNLRKIIAENNFLVVLLVLNSSWTWIHLQVLTEFTSLNFPLNWRQVSKEEKHRLVTFFRCKNTNKKTLDGRNKAKSDWQLMEQQIFFSKLLRRFKMCPSD